MKSTILVWIMTACSIYLHAQPGNIGDTLPDISFSEVLNDPRPQLSLSDLQGKIILAECWSSRCGACIASMIHLAELKKKYGRQLDIILVTLDDAAAVKKFLAARPDLAALGLPLVPRTREWENWFPHKSWPHLVWIGADRQVKAITESKYAMEKNINELLLKNRISLPVKKDNASFDYHASFLQPVYNMDRLYSSSFTGPIEGVGAQGGYGKLDSNTMRLYATNAGLRTLCAFAWRFQISLHTGNFNTRMIWKVKDSAFLEKDKYGFDKKYSYELLLPRHWGQTEKEAYEFFQKDIDRFFRFQSQIQTIDTLAWVIMPSGRQPAAQEEILMSVKEKTIIDTRLVDLIRAVESAWETTLPITVYQGDANKKCTVTLKTHYSSVEDIRKDVEKAGLLIRKKKVPVNYLVITN